MTRLRVSSLLIALLSAALAAQQTPQDSTPTPLVPASQASAAVTPGAPAQQTPATILADGTPVKLRLLNKLDSHTAKNGDEIQFDVVNDIVVGGVIVLRRFSQATGVVTDAKAARTLGREGKLFFTVNDVTLRDGTKVPVRAFNRTSGEKRTGEMIGTMMQVPLAAAPFLLLMHGTNPTFYRGTEVIAFVDGDIQLDMNSFTAASATATAADELKTVLQISSTPGGAQVQLDGASGGASSPPVAGAPAAAAAGSATKVVHDYLFAASTMDTSLIRSFLSSTCTVDIADEYKANLRSGWAFSGSDVRVISEKIDSANGKASVVAQVVYRGGNPPTFMAVEHTFFLVRESGIWKVSRIDPAPPKNGPGVVPVSQ